LEYATGSFRKFVGRTSEEVGMGEDSTGRRVERDPVGEKRVCGDALYNEERGFMGAAELAKRAIDSSKSVTEVVDEEKEEGYVPTCPRPYGHLLIN
jgi:hypothetical protein